MNKPKRSMSAIELQSKLLADAFKKHDAKMQEKDARYLIDFGYKDSFYDGFSAGLIAAIHILKAGANK